MARVKIERKTDWTLTRAERPDEGKIKSFLGANSWMEKDVDALYGWKFNNNPCGETLILKSESGGNEVVAINMFMPWRLRAGDRLYKANQWVDMFIKLEYRGQTIDSMSLDEFRRSSNDICFAFPNSNGVMVHKKNNGIHVGNIIRMTKPLDFTYLVKRYIKAEFLSKIISAGINLAAKLFSRETWIFGVKWQRFEKVERCGDEFDIFWNECKARLSQKIMTEKNKEYLQWKYVDSPNADRALYCLKDNNKVYGFAALEASGNIGYIVDMLALDERALQFLIAGIVRHFKKANKDSVVFVTLENNMYTGTLEKSGFVKRPETKDFYIYLKNSVPDKEYFTRPENWFITIGDCDIEKL